jgi:hypothetical protein
MIGRLLTPFHWHITKVTRGRIGKILRSQVLFHWGRDTRLQEQETLIQARLYTSSQHILRHPVSLIHIVVASNCKHAIEGFD